MRVPDAFRIETVAHVDDRGLFMEVFRDQELADAVGHGFVVAQANLSVSRRGTLRGLHGVNLTAAQAKVVSCPAGAALDVVVDLRVGSPTFGVWDSTVLQGGESPAVYVAEGLLHGFVALTDDTVIQYLCSAPFVPGTQIQVDALDPELALPWPADVPLQRSPKDAAAPDVRHAVATGLLPTWAECLDLYARLR